MNFWDFTAAVFCTSSMKKLQSEFFFLYIYVFIITSTAVVFLRPSSAPDFPPASFFLRRSSANTDRGVLVS